jgi:hypothetical protein
MVSQPIWFDPKLFAETRSYVGAVWLAGVFPAVFLLGGAAVLLTGMGPVGAALTGVVAWTILIAGAAPRLAARKQARVDARRRLQPCPSCGEGTIGTTCGACGAALGADGPGDGST